MPFSIVGSNSLLEVNGKRVRGRLYPWGVVEVENKDHCDFVKLRNMLIRWVIMKNLRNAATYASVYTRVMVLGSLYCSLKCIVLPHSQNTHARLERLYSRCSL